MNLWRQRQCPAFGCVTVKEFEAFHAGVIQNVVNVLRKVSPDQLLWQSDAGSPFCDQLFDVAQALVPRCLEIGDQSLAPNRRFFERLGANAPESRDPR